MTDIGLLVPAHIQVEEEAKGLEQAYVEEKDLYLDPSKLPEDTIDRLPQPTGWRVLILPYQGKMKSDGGILLTNKTRETEALATVCGYVLRVGPDAYEDKAKFDENYERIFGGKTEFEIARETSKTFSMEQE